MLKIPASLLLGLGLSAVFAVGCGGSPSSESSDSTSDLSAESADSVTADTAQAKDKVLVANAKELFALLIEDWDGQKPYAITYAELPGSLADSVAQNNPDPTEEWAAVALRAQVKNGKGVLTTVYAVIDGIDDEGADITVYGTKGSQLAEGDDYRGFRWN